MAAESVLGIDDVTLSAACERSSDQNLPGVDNTTPTPANCPNGMLPCSTEGQCYYLAEKCDFQYACIDETDEQDCSKGKIVYSYIYSFTRYEDKNYGRSFYLISRCLGE